MGYILSKEQLNSIRNETRFFSVLNESMNAHKRSAYSYEVSVFCLINILIDLYLKML